MGINAVISAQIVNT